MLGRMPISALILTVLKASLLHPTASLFRHPTAFSIHQLALLEALFLRRAFRNLHLSKSGRETLSLQFFPRRKRLLADALLQKTGVTGSSTYVAAKRFRSVLADERSGIARGTVLEAKPNGEYHDRNRIRDQAN